ncbi:conserved hypothetical protein [Shewanella sediminis HAW-EB3]|uniref:DUF4136 domain-containing protein n=1 Tax=Shewanella sediminis (strain HAW-EB3) TaxID=425104 RepID=A8FTD2_SHESH|nr:DUF4136 domain-containing protein [Shewanella sediminis]ABV36105.1 conserved hypothetical protein [Shewanella sediminis HAW-EB3]
MFKKLSCLLLTFMLTACVTVDVPKSKPTRATMVTTGDLGFLSQSTPRFAWHPALARVATEKGVNDDKVVDLMRTAMTKVMEAKGYHLVSIDDSPDLLLGFGIALESEMSDAEILDRAGLVPGLSTIGVDADKHEKGSVLVALFHPRMAEPAWRVLAQGFTDSEQDKDERQQRVDELVSLMLGAVPSI